MLEFRYSNQLIYYLSVILCFLFLFLILYKYRKEKLVQVIQRKLNSDQLRLLHVLYSFRFGTRSLIASYLNKPNNTSLYSRIKILEKYGYLNKRYESSYKLAGREAEFYITHKGALLLRDVKLIEATDAELLSVYKDKDISDAYVQQLTLLFNIRNLLTSKYELQWFTGRDIKPLDYFPKNRPAAFISLKADDKVIRCFVEYIPISTSISAIRGKLKQYSSYFQQDAWGETETPFPKIIYIAEDGMTEQGVRYHIKKEIYRVDTDIEYFTTTKKAILNLDISDKIWTSIDDSNAGLSLEDI